MRKKVAMAAVAILKFFWRMIVSAWMPFSVCMAILLSRIVLDVLAVLFPLAMADVYYRFYAHIMLGGTFFAALAIGLIVALFFFARLRWRQGLKRIALICAGVAIWFFCGRIWIDYSRELHPEIEIRIAGERLARIGDEEITNPENLRVFVRKLLWRGSACYPEVIFTCEEDVRYGSFSESFLLPCRMAGMSDFAFRMSDGKYPFSTGEQHNFVFISQRFRSSSVAAVMATAEGKLRFEAVYKGVTGTNDTGGPRFADTEESVFGEGRAEDGKAAAVVIAAPECKLPIVQNVIRRLSLSGYDDIVLMSPCLPEK